MTNAPMLSYAGPSARFAGLHRYVETIRIRFDWRHLRARAETRGCDAAMDGMISHTWSEWADLPGAPRDLARDFAALVGEIELLARENARPALTAAGVVTFIASYAWLNFTFS